MIQLALPTAQPRSSSTTPPPSVATPTTWSTRQPTRLTHRSSATAWAATWPGTRTSTSRCAAWAVPGSYCIAYCLLAVLMKTPLPPGGRGYMMPPEGHALAVVLLLHMYADRYACLCRWTSRTTTSPGACCCPASTACTGWAWPSAPAGSTTSTPLLGPGGPAPTSEQHAVAMIACQQCATVVCHVTACVPDQVYLSCEQLLLQPAALTTHRSHPYPLHPAKLTAAVLAGTGVWTRTGAWHPTAMAPVWLLAMSWGTTWPGAGTTPRATRPMSTSASRWVSGWLLYLMYLMLALALCAVH
jgi:hypothetical protein